MSYNDWIDDDEYPSDEDIERYGEASPVDYDPLTVGYLGDSRANFWTPRRIFVLVVALLMIAALVLPSLLNVLF